MFTINQVQEILRDTYSVGGYYNDGSIWLSIRPHIRCEDGFEFSMQASSMHYSIPREDLKDGKYECVELGYPNKEDGLIKEYAEVDWIGDIDYTNVVYPYVPIEVVARLIDKHGGIQKLVKSY